jgi:hypothetical protein
MSEAGEWGVRNFTDTPYTNPQNGQTYPVIRMTRKGFHFVVGKFTGAKAVRHQIAYADEFERMEIALRQPALPGEILEKIVPPAPTSRVIEDSYALAAALLPEIAKAIQSGLTGTTYRWFLSFDHLRKPFITSIPDDAYMLSYSDMLKTMMSADGAPLKTEELEVFINAATRKLASRATFHQQRALQGH